MLSENENYLQPIEIFDSNSLKAKSFSLSEVMFSFTKLKELISEVILNCRYNN